MAQIQLKYLVTPAFQKSLSSLRSDSKIKASLAWKLLPSFKSINEALKDFENTRLKTCEQYAKKDEQGEPIKVPLGEDGGTQFVFEAESAKAFNEEFKELLNSTVTLPDPVVRVSDLFDLDLSVEDLENLVGPVILGE